MIGPEDACYVCHTTIGLHKHHIFYGRGRRALSEKYGLYCKLCAAHHNMSDAGVHFNPELNLELKKLAQLDFESRYSHEEFMAIFGTNVLEDEDYEKHNSTGFINIDDL